MTAKEIKAKLGQLEVIPGALERIEVERCRLKELCHPFINDAGIRAALTAILDLFDRQEADLLQRQAIATKWIDSYPDEATREIMRLHYIDGWPWWQVAGMVHYSVESCYRRLRKAVKEIAR